LLTLRSSSQAAWMLLSGGGAGALLVSPFNMERDAMWRLEVWRSQSFASS
jgi:hypothetical protein